MKFELRLTVANGACPTFRGPRAQTLNQLVRRRKGSRHLVGVERCGDGHVKWADDEPVPFFDSSKHFELLEEARARAKDTFGPDHGLAGALLAAGRVDESLELYKQALIGRRTVLGVNHPRTLASMYGLATAVGKTGDTAKATKLLQKTLALQQKKLGEDHFETLKTQTAIEALQAIEP